MKNDDWIGKEILFCSFFIKPNCWPDTSTPNKFDRNKYILIILIRFSNKY